jgi:glycine betaine catabolism A
VQIGRETALISRTRRGQIRGFYNIGRHLVKVHIREYLGYVWVCLADEPPSFEEDVMGAIEERLGDVHAIDGYDVANLSLGRRIRHDVKANWKLIIENFMECYHCATIHPELTEVLNATGRTCPAWWKAGRMSAPRWSCSTA